MMKIRENPQRISNTELTSYDCTKILLTDFAYSEELVARYGKELNILVTDSGRLVQMMSSESSKENYLKEHSGLSGDCA